MEQIKEREITLERLLKHPLSKEFLGAEYDKHILYHQITDPMLKNTSYEEISDQGLRMFLQEVLHRGHEWENMREEDEHKFKEVQTVGKQVEDEDNRITLMLNDQFTELKIMLHKPEPGQKSLTESEIWKLLLKKGITYGVKKEFIIRLAEKPVYEKKFKLALGEEPKRGKDGTATFFFETVFDPAPKPKQDGKVDYKELNYVQNVKKGELLCELTSPEKGEDGTLLNGKLAEGLMGKKAPIIAGMNTACSEDRMKIYAAVDGSPHLVDGVLEVRKTLILDAVDSSTGNIEFAGNVRVAKDVEGAFTVRASGDIIVEGIVDGKLYAGGNIILKNGVKGGGKSYLEANKSIRAEFLENTTVLCRGSISADAILNSEVICWNNLSVVGRNGKIMGGKAQVGGRVVADEIGNEANTATSFSLEMADGEFEYNKSVEEKIESAEHMIRQLRLILQHQEEISSISRQIVILRVVYLALYLENQIIKWKKEIEDLRKKNSAWRSVCAKEILYPNVFIKIDGMFFRNASKKSNGITIRVSNGKMVKMDIGEDNKNYEKHF